MDDTQQTVESTTAAPPSQEAVERPRSAGLGTFASLRHRDYRMLWIGQVAYSGAMWGEVVARNWLTWDLTHSGLDLGLVNMARALPQFFMGLVAGVVLDRANRKAVLLGSLVLLLFLSAVMALLVATGLMRIWHLYLTAFALGAGLAFNNPARLTLLPEVVPREELSNAVSLMQVGVNSTRVLGPAVAGLLIGWVGVDGSYMMMGALLTLVLVATAAAHIPKASFGKRASGLWSQMLEGLTFVWSRRTIFTVLMVSLIPMFFAFPMTTLLTIYADEVLDIGAGGYGMLLMATGAGALAGALVLATFGSQLPKGLTMLVAAFGFGLVVAALGGVQWLAVVIILLVTAGAAQSVLRASSNDILLEMSPSEFRGRVMSMMTLEISLSQMGGLIAGVMADALTVQWALVIMGTSCVGLLAALWLREPGIRRL